LGIYLNYELTKGNNMQEGYTGFLLALNDEQRAKLLKAANKRTGGNITKLLQQYADRVK